MYIVAIAWLYVVFMMSITEQSAVAGVTTFLLYGVFPLTIVLYLMGTPQRKRNRQKKMKNAAQSRPLTSQADAPQREPDHTEPSRFVAPDTKRQERAAMRENGHSDTPTS